MDNDEFIKKIKRIGKIKPVKEAFIKYPVEEEEHKGKSELYLAEDGAEYKHNNTYSIGDIVFVKDYIYENGKKGNNHLFVIIGKDNLAVPIEYFGMLISSKVNKVRYIENKFLQKDEKNNLHTDSIVKTDVIYNIQNNAIEFKIGKIDLDKIEEYKESYLECNNN